MARPRKTSSIIVDLTASAAEFCQRLEAAKAAHQAGDLTEAERMQLALLAPLFENHRSGRKAATNATRTTGGESKPTPA